MRDSAPHRLTERRQAILRQTSAALRGRVVTLWRVARGLAVAEVASRPNPPRGALERIWAVADQATGYLCGALALLDACFERVRRVESLTPSARAHLLADLAVVEDAIEGALDAA